ncbi:uncharacterized protein [Melanerpes formicivorus]|uniref:uncharacterized protein n=1 Tax=Melanerpes formicivorus TaxID=211600 RepID=UPI00358F7196
MWLSPVVSLTVVLSLLCLLTDDPRLDISNSLLVSRRQVLPEELKEQPMGAERMAFKCPSGCGFCQHHGSRMGVLPEKAEQPAADPQCAFSEWPGSYSLRILKKWCKFWMSFLPENEKQPDTELKNTFSEWPGSVALRILQKCFCFRRDVLGKTEKQAGADPESPLSEWPGSFGLWRSQKWVRFRIGLAHENLKKPDADCKGTFSKQPGGSGFGRHRDPDLPFLPGQLWEHLVPADMICLLYWACQTVWLLCMVWVALGLWRNVKRPHGQGRSQTKDSWRYGLLCRMEDNVAMCYIAVHRLRLKELCRHYYKKAAQEQGSQPAAASGPAY